MSRHGRAVAHDLFANAAESSPIRRTSIRHEGAAHSTGDDARSSPGAESESTDLFGVTVLLVEDDLISREALEMILAYHGARVTSVASAADALAAYEQSLPTVVVSDIGLPKEDGCALLRAIRVREFGRGRHTPAVAISASPRRETSERAHGAGFDVFVPKPLDVPALLRVVHRLTVTMS